MKQLIDAREHGCNGIEPALSVVIKTRDRDFGEDDVAATRAQCKRLMAAERKVFGPRHFPVTFELGHEIAYFWDRQKAWFSFWPHSPEDRSRLPARRGRRSCEMAKRGRLAAAAGLRAGRGRRPQSVGRGRLLLRPDQEAPAGR